MRKILIILVVAIVAALMVLGAPFFVDNDADTASVNGGQFLLPIRVSVKDNKDFKLTIQLAKYFREDNMSDGLKNLEPELQEYLTAPSAFISGKFDTSFIDWFITSTYAMWDVPDDKINEEDCSFEIVNNENDKYAVFIFAYPYIEGWTFIDGDNIFNAALVLGSSEKKPVMILKNIEQPDLKPYAIKLETGNHPLHYIWAPEFFDLDGDKEPEILIRYNLAWADGFSQELAIYKIANNELSLMKRFSGETGGIARKLNNGDIEIGEGMMGEEGEGHLEFSKFKLTTWEFKDGDFRKKSEKIIPHILLSNKWSDYYEDNK